MAPIRLLSAADVERLLDLDALIDALARAFGRLSSGDALLGVMPGHLPGTGLGVKLVSVVPAHHARGLPSHQALIALFGETDGTPQALMDGTAIRALRATVEGADVVCSCTDAAEPILARAWLERGAHELQGLDPRSAVELGELVNGTRPGHEGEQELSVFKSMGHAVEDLAPAALVIERAEIEGVGTNVEL